MHGTAQLLAFMCVYYSILPIAFDQKPDNM